MDELWLAFEDAVKAWPGDISDIAKRTDIARSSFYAIRSRETVSVKSARRLAEALDKAAIRMLVAAAKIREVIGEEDE